MFTVSAYPVSVLKFDNFSLICALVFGGDKPKEVSNSLVILIMQL